MSEPAPEPLLPTLAVAAFIASVASAGALANCAVLATLLKHTRNGLFSIIIQLAVADLLLVMSTAPELWSINARTWNFGRSGCTIYQGLNVFTSTASLYLVTAIALHTLATINLEEKAIDRKIKRTARDEDEEIRSSQHSLVANSDSSTPPRTMKVDYRLSKRRIPVTLPSVFVWVLSASLSVPEFALASTVSLKKHVICTLDFSHRFNVHSMLAVFILFLPLFIMSTVIALIIIKLKSKKKLPEVDNCESVAALRLSLWLIIVNGLLCAPRSIVSAYSVYSTTMNTSDTESPIEVLRQSDEITVISLAFSSTYLISTLVRPLLYIIVLPRMRKVFSLASKDADCV